MHNIDGIKPFYIFSRNLKRDKNESKIHLKVKYIQMILKNFKKKCNAFPYQLVKRHEHLAHKESIQISNEKKYL